MHFDAAMASRDGQMGGHERVSGSGDVRPLAAEEAMAPKVPTRREAARRGEPDVSMVAFEIDEAPLEMERAA